MMGDYLIWYLFSDVAKSLLGLSAKHTEKENYLKGAPCESKREVDFQSVDSDRGYKKNGD